MTDLPILFSGPMVRSLLAGTKTQTRRVLDPQPVPFMVNGRECEVGLIHIYGDKRPSITVGRVIPGQRIRWAVGDRLWVRESWMTTPVYNRRKPIEIPRSAPIFYSADQRELPKTRLRPSIHMPRWVSRISLTVTDLRIERLQDINEDDSLAEGISPERVIVDVHCASGRHTEVWDKRYFFDGCREEGHDSASGAYASLWSSINGKDSWEANPFVVAITFDVRKGNIDA